MQMIKSIRVLGKSKNQIVINDELVFILKLNKHKFGDRKERVTLTAKRLGYTTKGLLKEFKHLNKEQSYK